MTDSQSVFDNELRKVLKYLYDPVMLRKSQLIPLLGLQNEPNAAEALRYTIEKAISALRPNRDVPATAKSQRDYQILFCRYVQQFTQRDVANQLGISPRHLRREQGDAIQALAETLRRQADAVSETSAPAPLEAPAPSVSDAMDHEMEWLGDSLGDYVAEVEPALIETLRLAEAIAQRHEVSLDSHMASGIPLIAVAQTVLKQIVLSLVTTAIRSVPSGRVTLAARAESGQVIIGVRATPGNQGLRPAQRDGVEMACRLAGLFKGCCAVASIEPLDAQVVFPAAEQIVVLAIEDNVDTLQLWARYVQDTRFRLIGMQEPQRALAMAMELNPAIILLDVMMPGMDGWELLGQLRNHPATSKTRIVVCTVLPQEELALSLGANDFIRKPFTRQVFQALLARQIAASERE